MRTDYRFFHDKSGYIKNIFTFDSEMRRPNNFIMPSILYFLATNRKTRGEIGIEGYFSVPRICDEMVLLGYLTEDTFKACAWLLENELIETDHMKTHDLEISDSVRLSPSGFMHLRVLTERIEYIVGVIPTTPIFDQRFAATAADRVKVENDRGSLPGHIRSELARGFLAYLLDQAKQISQTVPNFLGDHGAATYTLSQMQTALTFFANNELRNRSQQNELDH